MNTRRDRSKLLLPFFILFGGYACNSGNNPLVVERENLGTEVTFRVDSVKYPEVTRFPIFITIVNKSKNKLIIPFDSLECPSSNGINHIVLSSRGKKYLIDVRDKYLLCAPQGVLHFAAEGLFQRSCGFMSFAEIDSAFLTGRFLYLSSKELLDIASLSTQYQGDTLIIPQQIESIGTRPLMHY